MTVPATVATAAEASAVVPAVAAEAARRDSDLHVLDLPHGRAIQTLTAALDATLAEPGLDSRAVVICKA
jgi:hypothetical protein